MNFVCHKCSTCPVGVTFYTFIFLSVAFVLSLFFTVLRGRCLCLAMSEEIKSDWTITPESSYPIRSPDISHFVNLDFLCFVDVFKDALDHRLHYPQLFAKCVGFFGVNRGIFSIFVFFVLCFCFLMICPRLLFYCVDEKWGRNKRRQKDQLKAATYEWLL